MKNKDTILFLPSNKNHVQLFLPIYKVLKDKCNVLFLTQGSYKNEGAEDVLEKLGIEFKNIDVFEKKEPRFILKEENVKIIVIGNDIDIIPQWFVNTANKIGINTILIQDGILFDYKTRKNIFKTLLERKNSSIKLKKLAMHLILSKQYKKITYGMGGCSKILVWGKASESYLICKGVERNKIIITGNMRASEIKYNNTKNVNLAEKKNILYAPSDLVFSGIIKPKEFHSIIHQVCFSLSSLGYKVIVKPHPSEDIKIFNTLEGRYSDVEVSNQNIYELLSKSSLVVTDLSSFAIEALAANNPLVIFFPGIENIIKPESFPLVLIEKNSAFLAKDMHDLSEKIEAILKDELLPKKEFVKNVVEEYLGPMDNMEAARSANSIIELMNKWS